MLFSTETLQIFLNRTFSGYVLSDAFKRVEVNAHYKLIETGSDFLQATVYSGTLKRRKVTLRSVKEGKNLVPKLECECSVNRCKHQAMLLYMLIKEGHQLKQSLSVEKAYRLEGANPAVFRELDLNGAELIDVLEEDDRYFEEDYDTRLEYSGFFEDARTLVIKLEISSKQRWRYEYTEHTIILQKTETGIKIKCVACREKTNKLCSHQYLAIEEAFDKIEFLFNEGEWEKFYDRANAQILRNTNVTPEIIEKYFQINLSQRGWSYEQKSNKLLGNEWVENINKKISQQKHNVIVKRANLAKQLKNGNQRLSAYYWSTEGQWIGDGKVKGLFFCSGKSFKTKPGLQKSGRNFTKRPEYFTSQQAELAHRILRSTKLENIQQSFEETQKILLENEDLLSRVYHYIEPNFPDTNTQRSNDATITKFHSEVLDIKLIVNVEDGVTTIKREAIINEQNFSFKNINFVNPYFCADDEFIYLFKNKQYDFLFELFEDREGDVIELLVAGDSAQQLLANLRTICEVEIKHPDLKMEEKTVTEVTFQIMLREVGSFITFEPRLAFSDETFNVFDSELSYYDSGTFYKVDPEKRDFLLDFIRQAHPDFDVKNQVQEYVYLSVKEMMNNYWFLHFVESCAANEIEILGQKELSKFNYSKHRAKTYSHLSSGIDWFEVDMGVTFGKEKIKTADWIKALRNNESFIILKDGSMGMLPEEWLAQARKVLAVADVEKGQLKISKYRFNVIDDLFEELDDKKIIKELAEKKRRLAEYDTDKKYTLPEAIEANLRPYQKHGFAWLKFLDESGFGGILADDMGLGKTLQVISLLADQDYKISSMVIVPRSLLFNWAAELEKFCPSLTYVIHHGPNRGKEIEELTKRDLIISTYDTTAADIEVFKNYRFNYIVLDESQAIKNPDSKRYKAMRLLQSNNKIAMTGTPIENNTFDLYAQLSFTSPGLLGTKTSFRNNFAIPIDNDGNQEAANLLRKLIHPFILRRTKEQVANDLPDKTETILYCEMAPAQRKLYDKLKQQIKIDLEEEVEENGLAKSKFKILDGLLRLRQMCNSPLLVNSAFTGKNADSVKIKVLLQNLTEELDEHNALVFSQFTSLLAIVRAELDKRGIPYAYLDGSTRKRQKEVEKFMENSEIKIFLISIKAGNTGLNLTKADYVYILDPWWNPAVEAQAIDRTHRIGQDKQVFAYKLICKDSIEEKILKLQEKKKNLAQDLIRTDESVMKSLDKDTLMSLFD